jgi:hypothetical protein
LTGASLRSRLKRKKAKESHLLTCPIHSKLSANYLDFYHKHVKAAR